MDTNKKPNVLEKATGHYKKQISGAMKSYHVEEWDTTIYWRTIQSLKSESEVVELTRQGKSVEALVVTIINKARNEDGSMMFSKHDRNVLMNEVDPAVILKIANEMSKSSGVPNLEELEKN